MKIKRLNYLLSLSAGMALAIFAVPSFGQLTIVNDSFTDDDRAVTGTSGSDIEIPLFGTSGTNAIQDGTGTGTIGLVTGTSGRQIHGIFPTQSLSLTGDTLTSSVTFTTPTTVLSSTGAATSDDIRIGLFDTLGRAGLSADLAAGTGAEEPLLGFGTSPGLPGYAIELDVDSSASTNQDLQIRRADPSTTGRLLGTSTGLPQLGSGPDLGYVFQPDTQYSLLTTIERLAGGELEITATFDQVTGAGAGTIGSFTDIDSSPNSFDFGLIAFGASTEAFGSTNSFDTPADNGIELNNITITFDTAAIPEPGSAALLLSGLASLGLVRRRK